MASARTCPHRHSWYLDFQVLSGLRAFSADEEVRGPQTGGRLRHRLARSCLAQDAQRRARAASAGGRSEGCGREKRSRTSRDGLDETPDKTQRQKHRGQTDRSLRLAARWPRRSDKGQAKTVGVTHSSGNGCARLVNTERDVRRGSSDRETPCGHPAAPSAAPPPRPGGFCRGQAGPPPRWCPAEHARPLCDRAGSRPKHDRSTVTSLSRDRTRRKDQPPSPGHRECGASVLLAHSP